LYIRNALTEYFALCTFPFVVLCIKRILDNAGYLYGVLLAVVLVVLTQVNKPFAIIAAVALAAIAIIPGIRKGSRFVLLFVLVAAGLKLLADYVFVHEDLRSIQYEHL